MPRGAALDRRGAGGRLQNEIRYHRCPLNRKVGARIVACAPGAGSACHDRRHRSVITPGFTSLVAHREERCGAHA